MAANTTTAQQVTVAITNDNLVEATESFRSSLGTSTALRSRIVVPSLHDALPIFNDDAATFTINDVTVNEADSTATFTVSLSNPLDIPVTINVAYADITTSAGD